LAAVATVGVIGLGEIGRGVARALLSAGHHLVVCDLRAEATEPFAAEAHVAADPVEVGARSDAVIVAVVNDAQLLEVTTGPGGALATLLAGTAVIVLSTVSAATIEALAAAALRRDVDVLDCGVSGGPAAAANGTLVTMVSGDPLVLERQRPVIEAFSSLVVPMGGLGAGIKAKLARNLVQYASWLAAFEAQQVAEAAGIELSRLAEVIRASDKLIGGVTTLMWRPTVAPFGDGDDERIVAAMRAGASLAAKDLAAVRELGRSLGLETPLADMTAARCAAMFGLARDTGTKEEVAR
jgi:3-hydroxyisobutyrate dehydrogenase-like beta-hydroxyacid dehydrogenase